MPIKNIIVNDLMQQDYAYQTTEPLGKNFDPEFTPQFTPPELLKLGIFGGKYMTDCQDEFPKSWYVYAKLSKTKRDPKLNYFGVNASQSLYEWRKKGWIFDEDPRGWFQWYCRYYMGRRCDDDQRQIKRWKAMKRHLAQIKKNCGYFDYNCRPRQRQALLHWAYDTIDY